MALPCQRNPNPPQHVIAVSQSELASMVATRYSDGTQCGVEDLETADALIIDIRDAKSRAIRVEKLKPHAIVVVMTDQAWEVSSALCGRFVNQTTFLVRPNILPGGEELVARQITQSARPAHRATQPALFQAILPGTKVIG